MKTGERLLTATIDHFAETYPERICFSIPLNSSATEYVDISYKRFANSIDRLSWWLQRNIGLSKDFETVCYLGPPDLLYFIFALAACKCGFKSLFTSPRNSIEAHVNLLDKTSCHILFGPETATISEITARHSVDHKSIEPLEHWLDEALVEHFQHHKSFDDLVAEPWLVLHTSGTTGLPKPVNITHGLVSVVDKFQDLPPIGDKDLWIKRLKSKRILCCLPPFHSAGTNFFIFCIFFGAVLVLPPASQPPDPNLVETILDQGSAEAGIMAPSILEEIAASSSMLEKLRSWDFVAFGGSPLSKAAGDKVWDVTKVFNLLGSTESYVLPELEPEAKDEWQYHAFHPSLGLDFEKRPEDRFEAVFRRSETSEMFQGCFRTFKDKDTYPMGDLYSKHPSKDGLWLYRGRADDIIVLSNGEKFNPQDLESIVSAHPDVRAVLTVGNGKTQPALLIEPEEPLANIESASQQIEHIWETVIQANDALPDHAQIDKEHIAVLAADDQFPRSSKGGVQRQPTLEQKKDLIENLYNPTEDRQCDPCDFNFDSLDAFAQSLLECVQSTSKHSGEIDLNSNLFESGMDSLQAVQLSRKLRSSLKSIPGIPAQFPKPALIYRHPTVQQLAQVVMSVVMGGDSPPTPSQDEEDTSNEMELARKDYACEKKPFSRTTRPSDQKTVILTGSTGRLGSHLLHSLLLNKTVCKVHCLGRSSADRLRERQLKSQQEKGLSQDFERVAFHQFDVEKESWALDQDLIGEMTKHATHIIHNAWPVDFNHSFTSFKGQLQGCQTLLNLASQCTQLENLFFVSSVGAANRYQSAIGGSQVPEEIVTCMRAADPMGYAQSKLVAELLFTDAAEQNGLPTTVCRVGQIAGAAVATAEGNKSCWNRDEWFPSMIISSQAIGQIPKNLGAMDDIDWLPSDILGEVLVQMTLSSHDNITTTTEIETETLFSQARIMHAVNPHRIQWSTLLADLQNTSSSSSASSSTTTTTKSLFKEMKQVDLAEWVTSIRHASDDDLVSLNKVPAVKLLDFYEALLRGEARPVFDTTRSTQCSEALSHVTRIRSEWLEMWTEQWFHHHLN